MVIKKQSYNNEHGYEFLDQKRKRKVQEMRKFIHKVDLKTDELGLRITAYKTVVKIRIKLI
jgi:transposase